MISPYCFTDENLTVGFENNLERHNFNHANSLLNFVPTFPDFGIETR